MNYHPISAVTKRILSDATFVQGMDKYLVLPRRSN